jgi:hypothetical protein
MSFLPKVLVQLHAPIMLDLVRVPVVDKLVDPVEKDLEEKDSAIEVAVRIN